MRRAWTRVILEFHKSKHVFERDETPLRNLWDRLKKAAKKEAGEDARERRKTGGGEFISKMSDISSKVGDMIPEQINSPATLKNTCDSDSPTSKQDPSPPVLSNEPSERPQTSSEVYPSMSDLHER